ncbi:MAG: hypothetical protein M3033_03580 [Acidobacteriota bacterium]|nr:hypothetical protein [Acidobacteriota bacterium]
MNDSTEIFQTRSLTQVELDSLLSRLAPDAERAAQEYELIRRKLINFFLAHQTTDPETETDEVINRVARRISAGEQVQNLSAYFLGVARFYLKEIYKRNVRREVALKKNPLPSQIEPDVSGDEPEELTSCFGKCLEKLPDEDRRLILGYYKEEKSAKIDNRKFLSEEIGIGINALRIRAHRIRARLEHCIKDCQTK